MKTIVLFILFLSASFILAQESLTIASTETSNTIENSANTQANIWDVFQQRRSVRKFKQDPVPEKDIFKMIDAARMAPTAGNQQPWKFLVIQDKNKINQMKEACIKESLDRYEKSTNKPESIEDYKEKVKGIFDNYLSAPVYILILTDNNSKFSGYNQMDGPLAAGYLMLAARALGYGTVFITDAISENITKEVLEIPDNYTRVCITPVGIPVEWPDTPQKKNLEELISFEKI